MLRLENVIGTVGDPQIAERLHALDHRGCIEHVVLGREDTLRHRLRVQTDRGTECAIALPRSQRLSNGAVLLLEPDRAIVVRMKEEAWLRLAPSDAASALELGYFAGNMHWRVRFEAGVLAIALEGPKSGYLERLAPMLRQDRVREVQDG